MTPTPTTPPRRPLPGFGVKGRLGVRGRLVRGVIERGFARILWREPEGQRRAQSFPDTAPGRAEARAFGEAVYERLGALAAGLPTTPQYQPRTVRQVWDAYRLAEFDHLRAATRVSYGERWQKFETFHGPHRIAAELTRERLDEYRRALRARGHEINQVAHYVAMVRQVWRWAIDRDLLPPSKVVTYRVKRAKDEPRLEIAEYTREEATKIVAQFDPRDPRGWRPWVAAVLFAYTGRRRHAVFGLRWDDVNLPDSLVTWPAATDKTGTAGVRPVPPQVVDALWVAYGWRTRDDYRGPFVFYRPGKGTRAVDYWRRKDGTKVYGSYRKRRAVERAARLEDKPWSYAAFHKLLMRAETAAGVPHRRLRAGHGFRRGVIGDLYERTGDLVNAGAYAGSTDIRTLRRSYLKDRPVTLQRMADALGGGGEDET